MYNCLLEFINKHNILTNNQNGFRKDHSTYMALIKVTDEISQELNNKNYSRGIFIDVSKAFDTVDHSPISAGLTLFEDRGINVVEAPAPLPGASSQ